MEIVFWDEKNKKISKERGMNAITALKINQEAKDIPIVVLTHLTLEEREQVLSLGIQDYITKLEIMPKQIVERIEQLMGRSEKIKYPELRNTPKLS